MTELTRVARPEVLPGAGSRPGEDQGSTDGVPPERPGGTARDRALRLLAVRDRSRRELEIRLVRLGFHPAEVAEVVGGLQRVGLVDDERFARALAEHTLTVRRGGRRAAMQALLAKGVARDLAERTVDELPRDDEARAMDLASLRAARIGSVESLGGAEQATAFRRLTGLLVRRGHDPATARRAAARALGIGAPDEGA